ncbi:MAG: amidase [Mycobacterium sp.]
MDDGLNSASSIGARVRAADLSAELIMRAHVERIRGDDCNAFLHEDGERAISRARRLDRDISVGKPTGPLAGVPISVKDVIAVAGMPLTMGSIAFANNIARRSAAAVERLEAAGAIVVGKTNCPEFAFGTTCESPLGGTTLNPVHPLRSVGGSSGGDAAAVASGLSILGLGTDYGGSLRWPAACVGMVALRPTAHGVDGRGQVPGIAGRVDGDAWPSPLKLQGAMQTVGLIARSVEDLTLSWSVLRSAPPGLRAPDGLRVAWTEGTHIGPVRAEFANAVAAAAQFLDPGARHVPGALADTLDAYNELRALDPLDDHLAAVAGREGQLAQPTRALLRAQRTPPVEKLSAAWAQALDIRARAIDLFDHADILILPVAGGPACDMQGYVDVDGTTVGGWQLMAHCRAVTLTGCPAVSVPVGEGSDGLPIAVQVVAAPGRDDVALRAAAQLDGKRVVGVRH